MRFHVRWKQHMPAVTSAHLRILRLPYLLLWKYALQNEFRRILPPGKMSFQRSSVAPLFPRLTPLTTTCFYKSSSGLLWHVCTVTWKKPNHHKCCIDTHTGRNKYIYTWNHVWNKLWEDMWTLCSALSNFALALCNLWFVKHFGICQFFSTLASVWTVYSQLLMYKDSASTNLVKLVTITSYHFHGHANVSNLI